MSGYSIMTVNMNGHTNAQERRDLLSKIISEGSSLVFCQELPGFFQRDVVPDKYDCVKTENQAAVMWSKEDFDGETVDAGFKTKIFDTPPDSLKEIDAKILSEIPGRTAVVKLTAKEDEANFPKPPFLAVSWHAPHSGKKSWTLKKKQEALKGLILFLYEVCRQKDVSLIIIGGDFNLNTLEENGLEELNVHFQSYELSGRATARKEDRKNYISYKDNFAITTTSSSGAHSLEDMKLSEVKPLVKFVYVKEGEGENGEDIDILDHDPIIGVLQLGKTPSTEESEVAVIKEEQEVEGLVQSLDELSLTSTDNLSELAKFLRPSKGENKSLEEHKRQLDENIKRSGLKMRNEIPGDGNCLFHAVADQLTRLGITGYDHSSLRKLAVETLRNEFTEDELRKFLTEDVGKYLERMRKDKEWGDYFLIWALARALQIRIRVVTSSNSDQYERAVGQEEQPELLLGLISQFHFVSLEPNDVQDTEDEEEEGEGGGREEEEEEEEKEEEEEI